MKLPVPPRRPRWVKLQDGIARSWRLPAGPCPPWGLLAFGGSQPVQSCGRHSSLLPSVDRGGQARRSRARPHSALSQPLFVVLGLEGSSHREQAETRNVSSF